MATQLGAYWNPADTPGVARMDQNVDSRSTAEKVAMGAGASSIAPLLGPASIPLVMSYLGNAKKAKAAKAAAREARDEADVSNAAGEEGRAYGFTTPNGVAHNRASYDTAMANAQIAHNVGLVNESYGYLPTAAGMQKTGTYQHALGAKAILEGDISRNVGNVRDAGAATNIASSEAAARGLAQGAASTGMLGSSVDTRARQQVLGGFLSGRQATALGAGQMRTDARNQLDSERLQQLGIVRGQGQSPALGQEIAGSQTLDMLGQARSQLLGQAIGGTIGGVGTAAVNGYRTGQQQNANDRMQTAITGTPTGYLALAGKNSNGI